VTVAEQPLHGRGILVTRPEGTAAPLCELIRDAGGDAVRFPAIDILPPANPDVVRSLLSSANLALQSVVIFVSPTAVSMAFEIMQGTWPEGVAVAAVGKGTARALRARGVQRVLVPADGADSEALAALPALQELAGRAVLIVRGAGGREWLGETLRARGAVVAYAECYRRAMPTADAAPIVARWQAGELAAMAVTSRDALDNLLRLFATIADIVLATPVFASHPRIAEHARLRGFRTVLSCEPGDQAMVREMAIFFSRH
jgi:uroporphyrinogen-III synthase